MIYDHVSHYIRFKLYCLSTLFKNSTSAISDLVTFLDCVIPLVSAQPYVNTINFDFNNAFDLVSHTLLLRKLSSFGILPVLYGRQTWSLT